MIIPGAEPFCYPGSETGCLLIHGFTGAPKEMHAMGAYLAAQGYSVLGVRLAGHATQPEDMLRNHWRDWAASVEDGWHLLRGHTQRVFIIGLSMGGVLSLRLAAHYPVAGVVAMSTPFDLPPDPRMNYLAILQWFQPWVDKGPPDWHDPAAGLDHIDYPQYPLRGILQLRGLLADMRQALPKINAPVLLIHSRQDTGVHPDNMEAIYQVLTTSDKSMLWVDDSSHVVTRDPEAQRVFEAALQFIQRIEASPA